jgi:septal ring factor EnvC (AmiA/AmiB activator)
MNNERQNTMARPRTKPLETTPENFAKLLAQKSEIEKEISKQTKRLETVKSDLKQFKRMIDDLTK